MQSTVYNRRFGIFKNKKIFLKFKATLKQIKKIYIKFTKILQILRKYLTEIIINLKKRFNSNYNKF